MQFQAMADANEEESTPIDHAATIAKIVSKNVEGYYEALEKARERILAGEDQFTAVRDELAKAKAAEMLEFDRVQRMVANNQGNEKLLETLRQMRAQSVREWNILNGEAASAQQALDGYLAANKAAYHAYIPRAPFRKAIAWAGPAGDAVELTLAVMSGDDGELGKAVGGMVLGYVGTVVGTLAVGAIGTVVAVPALVGAAVIGAFAAIFSLIPDMTEDNPIWAELGGGIKSLFGFSSDVVTGPETRFVFGTTDSDVLTGTGASNALLGGGGDDILWAAAGNNNIVDGGDGADSLEGWDNDDVLIGGADADELKGGKGNDRLEGGEGFDTYQFNSADFDQNKSTDVILDADGVGKILYNSINIAGTGIGTDNIKIASLGAWETPDGQFRIWISNAGPDQSLVFLHKTTHATIVIEQWQQGDLGITLPDHPDSPNYGGVTHPGSGNADYLDATLNGTLTTGIHAEGGGGRDMVWGSGEDTEDVLSGGDGEDIINGRGGKDQILGGAGNDFISGLGDESIAYGGDGDDYLTTVYSYGFNMRASDQLPIDETSMWRDVQAYFGWQQGGFGTDDDGQLFVGVTFDTSGAFDFSGASVVPGWSYRFRRLDASHYSLEYFSASEPDGVDGNSGLITYGALSPPTYEVGLSLYGEAGNDRINGGMGSDFLDGGADNDLIAGGAGNDVIAGGDGDDQLAGGDGNDVIDGGTGSDNVYGGGGSDVVTGGEGDDFLWGDHHAASSRQDGGNDILQGGVGNDQLSGQAGNDQLYGGVGNDLLAGGEGDDRLLGEEGADELQGGAGNDLLDGGVGDDTQFGEDGDDVLIGGEGVDQLAGGTGNDRLDGGVGNDVLFGQAGSDALAGGDGDDELQGGEDDDSLEGGAGADRLFGQQGNDYLYGGAGDDRLLGNEGNDALVGGGGQDTLIGGAGSDRLDGDDGDDMLYGEAGADTLYGGAGDDYLDGDETAVPAGEHGNDVIDGGAGNDLIHGQGGDDDVDGGDGNDHVFGDDYEQLFSGNDHVKGGAGNDFVYGGAGDDVLEGGTGNDILYGGTGNDRFHFEAGFGIDQIVLEETDAGTDTISFGDSIAAADLIYSVHGADLQIQHMNGTDAIIVRGYFAPGTAVSVQLADGSTFDRSHFEQLLGVPAPTGNGTSGDDEIYGTEDDDNLHGGAGNDTLYGLSGDDYLFGGSGNDTFYGSLGNDVIDGGAGNDTYYFHYANGFDTILNLGEADAGSDVIKFGPSLTRDMISNFQISGDDLMIAFSDGTNFDAVYLEGFLSTANGTHILKFDDGTWLSAQDFRGNSDSWVGDASDDIYLGTNANNNAQGLDGNDELRGLGGNDRLFGNNGNDKLFGGDGDDALEGGDGEDIIEGGAGNDQLSGYDFASNDIDTLRGGSGDDYYYLSGGYQYGTSPDVVVELANEGTDTVYTKSYSYTLTANVENLVAVYDSNYWYWQNPFYPGWRVDIPRALVGNDLDNTIQLGDLPWGGSHDGRYYLLDGGAGNDTLIGTEGNETYVVDSLGDVVVETDAGPNASIDTIRTNISYSLAQYANIEILELAGSGDISGWGNDGNNTLNGRTSDGLNHLYGGKGDDRYIVMGQDVVVELSGEGNDTVVIDHADAGSVSGQWFDLADYANVENIALGNNLSVDWDYNGSDNQGNFQANLRGNAGDNVLTGNGFRNELRGGDGNDLLIGGEREPNTSAKASSDELYGEAGNDTLRAGSGGADLYGGVGDDTLLGGSGSDNFHYAIGDGRDTIESHGYNDLNRVVFAEGIDPDDVSWSRDGLNLVVQVGTDPADQIVVSGYWRQDGTELVLTRAVDQFVFADGTIRKGDLDQLPYTNNPPKTEIYYVSYEAVGEEAFSFTLPSGMFSDEAGDTLTLSLGSSAPDWLSIDPVTGLLTGTPPNGGADLYLQIIASDSWGQTTTASLTLNVRNVIQGTAVSDALVGTDFRDDLHGGAGDDTLTGTGYGDRLYGGTGNDTFVVTDDSQQIIELAGEGQDTVQSSSYTYTLGENVEVLTLLGPNAVEGFGNQADNILTGTDGDNLLDGGAGADQLVGGLGNDTYVVDTAADQVVELAGGGIDTVRAGLSWQLADNIENLKLTGEGNFDAIGNTLDNDLYGNAGNNRLEGGAGTDWLYGGEGDDVYVTESAQDRVFENGGEGSDTVERRFETNLVLSDNVENLILADGVVTGNGNALGNLITGNAAANRLSGLDGNDSLIGADGDDQLWGGTGNDVLSGGAGADYLDGGTGADQLDGGAGNDVYIVDDSGDAIVELAGGGTDQIQASATYTLAAELENLFLTGSAAIGGTGNALANYLAGNSAANVLNGAGGNDTLSGGAGDDTLIGGAGDDAYLVDASSASDVVDNTGGGSDIVFFSNGVTRERLTFSRDGDDLLISIDQSATPAVRVLNHFLGGDAAIDFVQPDGGATLTGAQINQIVAGSGSGFDQVIQGTAAGEQLVGSTGKDLIEGLGGADTLFGMGGNDTLRGGEGNDYLSGGNGGGTGSGDDVLEGGAGNDTLRGEDGSNTLTGGAGDDQYVYGGGNDVIDNTGGGTDWLIFQNGITTSQLAFTRDGDDLVITVNGNASQRVIVTDHFLGGDLAIDYLQPASGSALNTAAINALVTTGGGDDGGGDEGGGTPGTGNDADYPSVKTGTSAGEQIVGTSGRDLIKGLAGDDTLFGMGADDKLDGGDGDDYLSGGNGSFSGSGVDILIGGAGADQLVGEDGDDLLFGGTGDDTYFYAAGSGADTIDNTGGGTDWLYLDGISRTRLTYHRDGDDLIVRVDGSASQQMRVLDHFLGGEHAIAYVQPGDGGYAIPAATIAGQLTPLGASSLASAPMALAAAEPAVASEAPTLAADEVATLSQAMEAFAVGAPILQASIVAEDAAAPAGRRPPVVAALPQSQSQSLSQSLPQSPSAAAKPVDIGQPQPQTSPSTSVGAIAQPQAELRRLVDSLGSFASQQSSLPAANEGGLDEPWIIRGFRNDWRASHRNDGLRIRQLEL